jgi:RNA polymerase sigma-70 factor (ECF subfamily)
MSKDSMTAARTEDQLKTWMLLALDGDEGAYRRLLHSSRILLVAYYGRRMPGAAQSDVEDLVQETLLSLHARRQTYDRTRPFTAWFFAIARYKLIDHRRGRGGRKAAETELQDEVEDDYNADAVTARLDLDRLLDGLPAAQRDMIRQVRLEGLSVAETASRSGKTEAAVKVGIHRGLKALAAKMRGRA